MSPFFIYRYATLVVTLFRYLENQVQFLLDQGADPNVISTELKTPLYHALFSAENGNETAHVLVQGGADVNVTVRDGGSLLHKV